MQKFILPISQALLLALLAIALDLWFLALRCTSSPEIDGSRLAFAVALQLAAILLPLILTWFFPDAKAKSRAQAAAVAVLLVLFTIPMVRTAVLLSDTIAQKFYDSKGYLCPGVRFQ